MDKIFDLTDLKVVRSDNSETYCVLEKYFNSGDEALSFSSEFLNYITTSINEGNAKFYSAKNYFPFVCGYLPLVNFKLPNCVGYDEDGNFEYEGGSDFEMACCILDCKTYHDGRFEITLMFADFPDEIETNSTTIEVFGGDFY